MKLAKKILKITGIALGALVALLLLLYAALWIVRSVAYKESRALRQYVCKIPGINSGFCPQGVGYSAESELYVLTGYDGAGKTVMYIVENDKATRVYVCDTDGDALFGHGGGVTCTKDFVYIANDSRLIYYSLAALKGANGEPVMPLGEKPVDNSASFCFSDDTRIFVGEFYRPGNYETDEAHRFVTPAGDENRAIVTCYTLDEHGLISSVYPEYAISITGLVQGFAVSGDTYMLSRSYGLKNSALEYYSAPVASGGTVTLSFEKDESLGTTVVPLYYLDSSNLEKSLVLPAFSEDLAVVDDRVVVTNESACNKYIVGKLFPGADAVYSYPILMHNS